MPVTLGSCCVCTTAELLAPPSAGRLSDSTGPRAWEEERQGRTLPSLGCLFPGGSQNAVLQARASAVSLGDRPLRSPTRPRPPFSSLTEADLRSDLYHNWENTPRAQRRAPFPDELLLHAGGKPGVGEGACELSLLSETYGLMVKTVPLFFFFPLVLECFRTPVRRLRGDAAPSAARQPDLNILSG